VRVDGRLACEIRRDFHAESDLDGHGVEPREGGGQLRGRHHIVSTSVRCACRSDDLLLARWDL
jgi:hypothetical protein